MNISNYFNILPDYLRKSPTGDEVILAVLSIASGIIAGAYVAYPNARTASVTISAGVTFGLTISTIDSILKRYYINKKEQRLIVIDQEIIEKTAKLEKLTKHYPFFAHPEAKKKETELRRCHAFGLTQISTLERHIEKYEDDLEAQEKLKALKIKQTSLYEQIRDCRDEHPDIVKLKDDLAKLKAEKLVL